MDWMSVLIFIVIGGVIGWLASLIMKTDAQQGIIANVIVGIVGSSIGYWLAPKLGIAGGSVVQWLVAIGGAVLLIFALKLLGIFK